MLKSISIAIAFVVCVLPAQAMMVETSTVMQRKPPSQKSPRTPWPTTAPTTQPNPRVLTK